jgi:hypothetical protein
LCDVHAGADCWNVVAASLLELAGRPFGMQGVVSSMRPARYYTIPRESLESFFANLHELINFVVLEFQRVVFVENIFATVAVCRSYDVDLTSSDAWTPGFRRLVLWLHLDQVHSVLDPGSAE